MNSSVNVSLTSYEIMQAALVGVMRQVQNLKKRRTDHNGAEIDRGWQYHIEGALGEAAAAKYLNKFWSGSIGKLGAADVNDIEIRTASKHHYNLILQKKDRDNAYFILLTGCNGSYQIRGWILGVDGKCETYWKDPAGNRPAYFVPQSNLSPIENFPSTAHFRGADNLMEQFDG